jgi:hypothetical protein
MRMHRTGTNEAQGERWLQERAQDAPGMTAAARGEGRS